MTITDGTRTIELTMKTWNAQAPGYSPDFSLDYFDAGGLPRVPGTETHTVPDVQEYIDAAEEWQREDPETNSVFVDEV